MPRRLAAKKHRRGVRGEVYLMAATDYDDRHKVGMSTDVARRQEEVGPGRSVYLVHSFESADAYAVEAELKRRFLRWHIGADKHKGEWYEKLPAEIIEAFKAIVGPIDRPEDLPASLQTAEGHRSIPKVHDPLPAKAQPTQGNLFTS